MKEREVQRVLNALYELRYGETPVREGWVCGLDLARRLGVHAGTIQPILARLLLEGAIETKWVGAQYPRQRQYRYAFGGRDRHAETPARPLVVEALRALLRR